MPLPYSKILLPLDGSKLAEVSIPHAVATAQRFQAEIVLLQAVPPIVDLLPIDGYTITVDEQFDSRKASALAYFDRIPGQWGASNLVMHSAVEMGQPAEVILEYAQTHAMDLIVMATHGRSGVKRWVLGSVAEKVLRSASAPVLLIRAVDPGLR